MSGSFLILFLLGFWFGRQPVRAVESTSPVLESIEALSLTWPKTVSCKASGCNGELCVDSQNDAVKTPCVAKPEFSCYKNAICERQGTGCGWRRTPELLRCLYFRDGEIPPLPTPTIPTICGNGRCESGEGNYWDCPRCESDPCPLRPCALRQGSCPADCVTITPTPTISLPVVCARSCPAGTTLVAPCNCLAAPLSTASIPSPSPTIIYEFTPTSTPIMHETVIEVTPASVPTAVISPTSDSTPSVVSSSLVEPPKPIYWKIYLRLFFDSWRHRMGVR